MTLSRHLPYEISGHVCVCVQAETTGPLPKASMATTVPVAQLVDTLRTVKMSLPKGSTDRTALALLTSAGQEELQGGSGVDLLGAATRLSTVADTFAAAARVVKTAVRLGQLQGADAASPDGTAAALQNVERALLQELLEHRHCVPADRNRHPANIKAHEVCARAHSSAPVPCLLHTGPPVPASSGHSQCHTHMHDVGLQQNQIHRISWPACAAGVCTGTPLAHPLQDNLSRPCCCAGCAAARAGPVCCRSG